jgi:hypothetical protein
MKSRLILPAVLVGLTIGCGPSEADRTRSGILRVLQADRDVSKKNIGSLPKNAGTTRTAAAIGAYFTEMEKLELNDCPAEFRVAFRNHVQAWREMQAVVMQMPDGIVEGILMGAFNGVMGELDGGQSRLNGALQQAQLRVRDTYEEVEKLGAKYGAAL